MFLQFPTILVELPKVPGAAALCLPLDAPGRLEAGLKPPTLIMATLRALKRHKPDSQAAPSQWLLEIEGNSQALNDLRIEAAHVEGLRWHDGRWWRFPDHSAPLREISTAEAEGALWRRCAGAVLDDLLGESIADALQRLEAEYQEEDAKVRAELASRADRQFEHVVNLPAWPLWLGLWWLTYRTISGAQDAWEIAPDNDWLTRLELGVLFGAGAAIERKPEATLRAYCMRKKGLLHGVRVGGSGDYEPIDPLHVIEPSFSISQDCASASVGGVQWRGLSVDREKLWEIAPPPAVLLMGEVRELFAAVMKADETEEASAALASNAIAPSDKKAPGRSRRIREAARRVILEMWTDGAPIPSLRDVQNRLKSQKGEVQSVERKCYNKAVEEAKLERAKRLNGPNQALGH